MLLFDDRNSAAAAGNYNLSCISKGADGVNFHNINRLWSCYNTAEAPAGLFCYIIALAQLGICLFLCHISANDFIGLIEGFIIRIDGYLCQDCADRCGNPSGKKLGAKGILNIIAYITLAHSGADAHGNRRIIRIDAAQLGHCLVNHANLRTVGMCDGKLVIGLRQICERLCRFADSVPLFSGSIAKCLMAK